MQHPDEGTIHAWLDGALSDEEGAAIETHARECSECAAQVAEARGLIAASSRIVSALDVVPGGVIPVQRPVARRWYASAQFRAAAAVLFVAGASMVLLRGRDSEPLSEMSQRVMSVSATESAGVAADMAAPAPEVAAATVADSTAQRPKFVAGNVAKKKAVEPVREADGKQESMADAVAQSAPPPVAAADRAAVGAAAPAERQAELRKMIPTQVVVTGAASANASNAEDLRVVRADTTGATRVTVYQVTPGVEVTLTETRGSIAGITSTAQRERRFEASRAAEAAPVSPPPAPVLQRADSSSAVLPVARISWVDPIKGRTYVLSGRVSRQKLEEIRKKIETAGR